MKRFLLCALLFAACFSALTTATYAHDEVSPKPVVAEPKVQSVFDTLMGAIQDESYTSFLTVVDDDFKEALTQEMFESVAKQVAPRQKEGYDPVYFGFLDRQGYKVHLWKLTFKDKGDDVLAELSLKDEKVGGFFLR